MDAERIRRLRAPILAWYRRRKRDLPWRRTSDPYAIWVSEVMLQQTTVAAVVPYYERFLDRFPDPAALASASEEDVLAAWSGLGYYRRARALREGAIAVMERHGGRLPEGTEALLELPGVGRYTAGAIQSVAFGRARPVVDGNVKRVYSRLFALEGTPREIETRCWSIAEALVRGRSPGNLNQAVMELGATVCVPKNPRCPSCPLSRWCLARREGRTAELPASRKAAAPRALEIAVAWIEDRGRVLLERKRTGGALRGAWDLPMTRGLAERHGLDLRLGAPIARVRHAILDTRLAITVRRGSIAARPAPSEALRWVASDELDRAAVSGATLKIARALAAQSRSQVGRASFPSASGSGSIGRVKA